MSTPRADTLIALQFVAQHGRAPFAASASVRLSGPSGAISGQSARILARRAFRVSSKPAGAQADGAAWRFGWAYIAESSNEAAARVGSGYQHWMLLPEQADTARRR
jgi:hypothetical protein